MVKDILTDSLLGESKYLLGCGIKSTWLIFKTETIDKSKELQLGTLSAGFVIYSGHGGFSAKFGVGVCNPQFQNGTLARPIFVKMIPFARQSLHQKCHQLAFSRQNLHNFRILWTKILKSFSFFAGIIKV